MVVRVDPQQIIDLLSKEARKMIESKVGGFFEKNPLEFEEGGVLDLTHTVIIKAVWDVKDGKFVIRKEE